MLSNSRVAAYKKGIPARISCGKQKVASEKCGGAQLYNSILLRAALANERGEK